VHAALALAVGAAAYTFLEQLGAQNKKDDAVRIKPAVLAAHSYVPSNWLAGLGMSLSNQWSRAQREAAMKDPARLFDYTATAPLDDTLLVVVIGESARSTNFGVLGYSRNTTPQLAKSPEWAAFSAHSCNTSTKLSLQCMFVRPSSVKDNGLQAPEVLELPVFTVFKKLGFSIELFAMQSEVWFYNSVSADFYKIREVIAAEPEHVGKPSHDRFLLDEVAQALARHPKGKRVIILHTKGSHFLYTARYPREFANFQPECAGLDAQCTQQQLINSYDNSIVYLDDFLARLTDMLGQQKALVVYTSDHGESIGENLHFHATPKPLAPPEQSAVPLLMWASKPYLAEPMLAQRFAQLKAKANQRQGGDREPQVGHHNLFDSLLGCLGIGSKKGGIDEQLNLCH
jgi:KDO II ethanolaminephosphotransferase